LFLLIFYWTWPKYMDLICLYWFCFRMSGCCCSCYLGDFDFAIDLGIWFFRFRMSEYYCCCYLGDFDFAVVLGIWLICEYYFCFCEHASNKLYDCSCFNDFNFNFVLWIWYTELSWFVYTDFILNLT
jgi:hypothetical protein